MTAQSLTESPATPPLVERVRQDFPILEKTVHGHPLAYLDNAASIQRPLAVISRVDAYEREGHANIHRGVHTLSQSATEAYEAARAKVARFLGAQREEEIIFTRGATEAINLVAQSFARPRLREGDVILLTEMEHHANIVPWQMIAAATGARVVAAPVTEEGELDLERFGTLLREEPVKMCAVVHASNSLGTINPVQKLVELCKTAGVPVLVDIAQAVPHGLTGAYAAGADFVVFSGHKVFAPTGIGVLCGRYGTLETMPPYQGGGDMIERVSFAGTTFKAPPARFEAGTPHISGAIGLGAAIDYLDSLDLPALYAHESALLRYATQRAAELPGLRIWGTAPEKVAVFSFTLEGAHPHDIATFLDTDGIAVRAGHHCCQPLMQRLGIAGTARASFAFYNTFEEVDRLFRGLHRIARIFG
ncbi:MAG: SufS family cysteine desulfurase [Opitutales bacterium]|nr:SufS family cysteine desulfurase [Opitutales bacterium]